MKISLPLVLGLLLALPMNGICFPKQDAATFSAMTSSTAKQTPAATAAPAPEVDPSAGQPITGKVLQTMNSGGYSYVLVKKANGETVWIAMTETDIVVGKEMSFRPGMVMTNFPSKALKRTFESIIFSEGPVAGTAKDGKKEAKKSPGSKGSVVKADEKIKVAKATGKNAYQVSDLYRLKIELNKRKVTVRGKVVKVSANIMDRNWIHIQDGSGDAKKGTNNLVVTSTTALPSVGDVVTIKGTAYKDKDFGGGYKYDVIVEKADVTIEQ